MKLLFFFFVILLHHKSFLACVSCVLKCSRVADELSLYADWSQSRASLALRNQYFEMQENITDNQADLKDTERTRNKNDETVTHFPDKFLSKIVGICFTH